MSYTSFEYSDLQLTEIDKKNKSVALSFNITNTGGYEGAEVAQVYVRDIASKEARPLKELKGFKSIPSSRRDKACFGDIGQRCFSVFQ